MSTNELVETRPMAEYAEIPYAEIATADDAIWALARALYEAIEHLDPSEGAPEWSGLSATKRIFWRLCIEQVLARKRIIRLVLS